MIRRNKIKIPAFFITFLLTASLLCAPLSASAYELPAETTVGADAALLVSLGSTQQDDTVLFERQADKKRSPAALVRLMVGLTAVKLIQDKNMDIESVTGTYTQDNFNAIAGSQLTTAGMKIDDVWTVRDLLSMSMIQTAADACITLAVTLDGSEQKFVEDMNALAKEIGCTNTSFSNVTGKDEIYQYVSARDLYKIIRYGMTYPEFETLFSTTQYETHPVVGESTILTNTCGMLRPSTPHYYSPMVLGKSGYTDPAGRCLASVARDSGYEYLCVVLGSPIEDANGKTSAHYDDTETLYHWAFRNFTYKTLLEKNRPIVQLPVKLAWSKDSVTLVPENSFAASVANGLEPSDVRLEVKLNTKSVNAPVTKGKVYGKVELYINIDQKIGEVNLIANESMPRNELLALWEQIQKFLNSPWFYILLVLLILLLIGYVILNIVHNQKRRKNRMKRVKRF